MRNYKDNRTKITLIIIGATVLGFILIIGIIVYLAGGISYTSSPIKRYKYSGSIDEFETEIKKFDEVNPTIVFQTTWRDRNDSSSARDMDIHVKNDSTDVIYNLVYISKDDQTIDVDLNGIHDLIHKKGGYSVDDPGAKELFDEFEKDFLTKLKTDQHIILK